MGGWFGGSARAHLTPPPPTPSVGEQCPAHKASPLHTGTGAFPGKWPPKRGVRCARDVHALRLLLRTPFCLRHVSWAGTELGRVPHRGEHARALHCMRRAMGRRAIFVMWQSTSGQRPPDHMSHCPRPRFSATAFCLAWSRQPHISRPLARHWSFAVSHADRISSDAHVPPVCWCGNSYPLEGVVVIVRTMATISGQTRLHHPKVHPPKQPIEPQKTSIARHTTSLPRILFTIANNSPRRRGSFCSFLEAP